MTGIQELHAGLVILADGQGFFAWNRLALGQGLLHIPFAVNGVQQFLALAFPAPVLMFEITFIKAEGIMEHDRQQFAGADSTVNRAFKTLADEQGNQAAMVQVGMGKNQAGNLCWIEVKSFLANAINGVTTLVHAAIQ